MHFRIALLKLRSKTDYNSINVVEKGIWQESVSAIDASRINILYLVLAKAKYVFTPVSREFI